MTAASATFLRVTSVADKAGALRAAIEQVNVALEPACRFRANPAAFLAIPGSPLCYWIAVSVRNLFGELNGCESEGRILRQGLATADDFRFLRAWWESESVLPAFAKGGRFSRFYDDLALSIRWTNDGGELKAWSTQYEDGGHWSRHIFNVEHYFRPGLTWPLRTGGFSVRALPSGAIFGHKGPALFVAADRQDFLLDSLATMVSRAFDALVRTQLGRVELAQSFEVGLIRQTPVPSIDRSLRSPNKDLAKRAWGLKRSLDTITETSHAFHLPALLQVPGPTLADRAAAWATRVAATEAELAEIQREIDDIAFRLYGIDGEDRARIEADSGAVPASASPGSEDGAEAEPDPESTAADESDDESDDTDASADLPTLAAELLSWSIGVAFGRFDLRLATGERAAPPEPGPFDPLPACSPGMFTGPDGLPRSAAPPGYPIPLPAGGVLVDDENHPQDLVARVRAVFDAAFPHDGDARLDEAVHATGSPDLRTWLRRAFFPFHLRRYSKSRRKAPIWWPISTASGSYTVWLSWPRLSRDTLYSVLSGLVRPKRQHEERRLLTLRGEHGPNPSTRQRAEQEAQEGFVAELGALAEELERVAPLWNPVHDDGVILHFALLWRLVRDAAWQKECRAAWDKLASGAYDWAQIAMHLWPERVVPKCRADRSLAIAHGLEDTFWVEIDGKWRARDATDAALAEAVAARGNPAIRAALQAFQQAPPPVRGGKGRR